MEERNHLRRAQFTRPADTTTYTAGDAMGAGSAAGDCILEFPNPGSAFRAGKVTSARLTKSDPSKTTADTFRLLLFRKAPSVDPDDNAAPTTSWVKHADRDSYIGSIDFETAEVHADCIMYEGQDYVPSGGLPYQENGQDGTIYGILTALGAYEPASAEVFTVQLAIDQN
jgi:hypothetical protein